MDFICTKCGECCRHISDVPELKSFDLGNGTCRYLDGNICRIYADRPIVCNGKSLYEMYYSKTLRYEEYLEIASELCSSYKRWRSSLHFPDIDILHIDFDRSLYPSL